MFTTLINDTSVELLEINQYIPTIQQENVADTVESQLQPDISYLALIQNVNPDTYAHVINE